MGDVVNALYMPGKRWYPGTVNRANDDGTFQVAYEDGDFQDNVDGKFIRKREKQFEVDDVIEAMYKGQGRWYKGYVSASNPTGTYNIVYDDGEYEKNVPNAMVRKPSTVVSLKHGDIVEARYREQSFWYKGRIVGDVGYGYYDIAYDDGEIERGLQQEYIRLYIPPVRIGPEIESLSFNVGTAVKVRYRGKDKFYKGKVDKNYGNHSYDILYDDGEREVSNCYLLLEQYILC